MIKYPLKFFLILLLVACGKDASVQIASTVNPPPALQSKPLRVQKVEKRKIKKVIKVAVALPIPAPAEFMESDGEQALNLSAPLDELIDPQINENIPGEDPFDLILAVNMVRVDNSLDIPHITETLGEFQKDDFGVLHERLDLMRGEEDELDLKNFRMPRKIVVSEPRPVSVPQSSVRLASASNSTDLNTHSTDAVFTMPPPSPPVSTHPVILPNDSTEYSSKIFGKLELDDGLLEKLERVKGHVELSLESDAKERETIFLEYEYPDPDFEFDTTGMVGNYQLAANFFKPGVDTPWAVVQYPKLITAESHREFIRFRIHRDHLESTRPPSHLSQTRATLSINVFEGASGNYRDPKPVAQAQVRFVAHPDWTTFTTNTAGHVRIESIPIHSEYLLEVSRVGFLTTYKVVPVVGGSSLARIYLLSKDKVDTITQYFSSSPQKEGYGVVMGRVFDTRTRRPKAGERLDVAGDLFGQNVTDTFSPKALYVGALPNASLSATTDTGLFGFFNLMPGYRIFERESDSQPALVSVRPNTGSYIEFGRSGVRMLRGRLLNPFGRPIENARVSLLQNPRYEVEADEKGKFVIKNIDLPEDVLTLEVAADGFPTTLHPFSWSTKQMDIEKTFFLVEDEIFQESTQNRHLKKGRGSLLAGALPSFFPKKGGCVYVQLFNARNGKRIHPEKGPFPLLSTASPIDNGCILQKAPGFVYHNLLPGDYILRWKLANGTDVRSHVVHVGSEKVTIMTD